MSDAPNLTLMGKMVAHLQSGVEDVRRDYANGRASLTTTDVRLNEFSQRLSILEVAQMRLGASIDDVHTKLDLILSRMTED